MRVCDRCMAVAIDEIILTSTDEHYDLCATCLEKVKDAMKSRQTEENENKEVKKIGRPKKQHKNSEKD